MNIEEFKDYMQTLFSSKYKNTIIKFDGLTYGYYKSNTPLYTKLPLEAPFFQYRIHGESALLTFFEDEIFSLTSDKTPRTKKVESKD